MMFRASLLALFSGLLVLSAGGFGQDPKPKEDPKTTDKKDDPAVKLKGTLPRNWKKLGLSDKQIQDVYRIQAKYGDEIDKLKAKITELEAARTKDEKAILTPEQKKHLEELLLGEEKTKDK